MTHREYARDLAALTAAAALTLTIIAFLGLTAAAVTVLIVAPFVIVIALIARAVAGELDATDHYCSALDQELDARRHLRVVRTVTAEPQPAPAIDLFTREPAA